MRSPALRLTSALCLVAIASPGIALADDSDPWTTRKWASWDVYWENDLFHTSDPSDQHYTNGLRFSWVRNPVVVPNPGWVERWVEGWCAGALCPDTPPDIGYGHAVGQNFYTPTDITVAELIPDDRPYAAWLYYSFLMLARNDTHADPRKTRPVQNLFELQLGVVGEQAGGKFVQREWHKLIGSKDPRGWDNQLSFEPGINGIYLWRKRIGNRTFDFVPHWGGAFGNIMIYANAGATLRLGFNLSDFPQLTVPLTVAGRGAEDPQRWEAFLLLAADGRAFAHNIFLDGNTLRDSHSVDKETFVYDLKAGFAVRYKSWQLNYTFVRRSKEFDPPPAGFEGEHDFGSLSVSYRIWPAQPRP